MALRANRSHENRPNPSWNQRNDKSTYRKEEQLSRPGAVNLMIRYVGASLTFVAALLLSAEEFWVLPVDIRTGTVLPLRARTPFGLGKAQFNFAVPKDFEKLVSVSAAIVPDSTSTTSYDVSMSVAQNGDAADAQTISLTGVPLVTTQGAVTEIDLTELFRGRFETLAPGDDYVSITLALGAQQRPHATRFLGLRVAYQAARPEPGGGVDFVSETFDVTLRGNAESSRSVRCQEGAIVLSGGCQIVGGGALLTGSFPFPPVSWACSVQNPSTVPLSVRATVHALCADRQ